MLLQLSSTVSVLLCEWGMMGNVVLYLPVDPAGAERRAPTSREMWQQTKTTW